VITSFVAKALCAVCYTKLVAGSRPLSRISVSGAGAAQDRDIGLFPGRCCRRDFR
jgi:hypothetical protein